MENLSSIKNYLDTKLQKKIRLMPSIFVAGFQKCGTTSLSDYLSQTKSLVPGKVKEKNNLSYEKLDLADYLKNFPFKQIGKKTFCGSHQLTYFPKGLSRLAQLAPNAKIILVMRNPVDRAYSMYQHNCRNSDDHKKSFSDWINIELDIISSIRNIEDIEEIFEKTKWRNRPEGSWDMTYKLSTGMNITRGIYYNYIRIIKDLGFNFYPIFIENIKNDFYSEMGLLLDFLEVDSGELDLINPNESNLGGYKERMSNDIRNILEEFYEPHNEKLFRLLNMNNPWKSTKSIHNNT